MRKDRRHSIARIVVCAMGLASCASNTRGIPRTPRPSLPLSERYDALSLRIESRALAPDRVTVILYVVPRRALDRLVVDLRSRIPALRVQPSRCVLEGLSPPVSPRSRHPPYALPRVPSCSWVLSRGKSARTSFPLRVHIEDARGADVIEPLSFTATIPGGSR